MISHYLKPDGVCASLGVEYVQFLRILSERLAPSSYLEIGTNEGASLAAFSCDALCIDPDFRLQTAALAGRRRMLLFQMTSDQFFRAHRVRDHFPDGSGMCFLDGLHRFEFLLRDFMNAEACCRPNSLILMHDCLPLNLRMAEREMIWVDDEDAITRDAWTGDVWRILPALRKFRPDLRVLLLDCGPTGLVACTGLDPESQVLRQNYNAVMDEFTGMSLRDVGIDQLWNMFPVIDTTKLSQNSADITAVFNIS